jgi:broad specificity polyphosphatase/5'/3'-nucleotidase SurE
LHILVINDDSVNAPGLLALDQAFGHVSALVPDRDWSGACYIKTFKRPLSIRDVKLTAGYVAVTPLQLDLIDYKRFPPFQPGSGRIMLQFPALIMAFNHRIQF